LSKFIWTPVLALCAILHVAAQTPGEAPVPRSPHPTCDTNAIAPYSYALTTRAQARIVNDDRSDWWDGFNLGNAAADLYDLNSSSAYAAEHALDFDPNNLLAHGLLARQY